MLLRFADLLVWEWLGLDPESRLAGALHFFIYDTLKISLLLAVMIFLIGFFRTWLSEARLRSLMSRGGVFAYLIAALFGALTPFCSCSSVPIFIGLLKARVPLGVAFAFMITSPLVNEYLLIVMASQFGWPITAAYAASGLLIGTVSGLILSRFGFERFLEHDILKEKDASSDRTVHTLGSRIRYGFDEMVSILKQIWVWILVGVGVGALLHNYVPQETLEAIIGKTGIFSVPLATALGVPMYGNCAAVVPVAVVLFEKGIPLGTALAFMMSMAGLSLPEAIMVRRVMRLELIAIYFAITAVSIIFTGYVFNALAGLLY
jgi:uncharacterized membrane protein YraQ (UPF0718 family)